MFKFRKKSHQEVLDNIPNHIGIIMDGNGRWAKKRLQPRVMGHKQLSLLMKSKMCILG